MICYQKSHLKLKIEEFLPLQKMTDTKKNTHTHTYTLVPNTQINKPNISY